MIICLWSCFLFATLHPSVEQILCLSHTFKMLAPEGLHHSLGCYWSLLFIYKQKNDNWLHLCCIIKHCNIKTWNTKHKTIVTSLRHGWHEFYICSQTNITICKLRGAYWKHIKDPLSDSLEFTWNQTWSLNNANMWLLNIQYIGYPAWLWMFSWCYSAKIFFPLVQCRIH